MNINWVPIVIVLILWALIIGALIITNMRLSLDIIEIYDKCTEDEVRYKYFIKIELNPRTRKPLDLKKHTITMRVHDKTDHTYVTTFAIRLIDWIELSETRSKQEIRFILNRKDPINDWGFVSLLHSYQKGSVYIYSMQIIGIDSNDNYLVTINKDIQALNPTKKEQHFECKPSQTEPDDDSRPSKQIQLNEALVFFYLSYNLVLVLTAIITYFDLFETTSDFVVPLISTLTTFFIQLLIILFYRLYFKLNYWKTFGANFWNKICLSYLVICFIAGTLFGAATIALLINRSPDHKSSYILLYSLISLIILNFLFIVLSNYLNLKLFIPLKEMSKTFRTK